MLNVKAIVDYAGLSSTREETKVYLPPSCPLKFWISCTIPSEL